MKAIRFHEYGDPGVLRYEDTARPEPAAGEVLVKVAATSFNPGVDVAGTIAALGPGVTGSAVGDRVIGYLPMVLDGAAAEFVAVPAELLAPAPKTVPLSTAAALPVAALTAWQALFEHAGLRGAGQRVLINGAGGGVGGFAVQLAKHAGAEVIATAGPRSAEAVRAQGADQIIDYTATAVAEALTEPVDVVLNLASVAESDIRALTASVKDGGVIVTTATPANGDPDRSVRAVGMQLRADADRLAELAALIDAGELRVEVSASYPLSATATVHELAAAGKIRGKVLLTPDPESD
jgi:NADPH:quinone reductase-like Zn-dependent oxidoreductase